MKTEDMINIIIIAELGFCGVLGTIAIVKLKSFSLTKHQGNDSNNNTQNINKTSRSQEVKCQRVIRVLKSLCQCSRKGSRHCTDNHDNENSLPLVSHNNKNNISSETKCQSQQTRKK